MARPWNGWYHCTSNTYGTWLRGSDLGFRERHHRRHVEGDYKNPPPAGKYEHLKRQSRALMPRPPVRLAQAARVRAVALIVDSFHLDAIDVVSVALDAHHLHCLIRCPDGRPRWWVGRAKGRAARALIDEGLCEPGGVWAVRCGVKAVRDRTHQVTVAKYILDHRKRGAATWRIRRKPSGDSFGRDHDQSPVA